MREINNLQVYRRGDGKWDFRVIAAENGNILSNSDQGYNSREECRQIGVRVLSGTLGTIMIDTGDQT